MLFDLSQMTVIDESVNADEYDDMEFVEWLEFLVRIAYHQYESEQKPIHDSVSSLLKEILPLCNLSYAEPAKHQRTDRL